MSRHSLPSGSGDGLEQLLLAGAGDARDAEDLAAHGGEGDVVKHLDAFFILDGQVLDLETLGLVLVERPVNVQ